ncbi:endospore coat-associated protein [Gordoniibacillus kamchatkensis]|uniref:Endospore coat-associated protein n=2 Tax=Gordoniibacillus kamchatkensis TaxID=1590651 RepID=A0ABR5AND0_9BACL|nr:endospore coat-associated protein [Paenibacillus sp. VKM B-2647]
MAVYLKQNQLEELPYFRLLSERGRALGLDVFVFGTEDVKPEKSAILALRYDGASGKWVRRWARVPDLVYDRCRYQGPVKYHDLKAFRTRFPKLLYLGRPLANKWAIYKSMLGNEQLLPHLPETHKFSGIPETVKLVKKHRLTYLKPRNGTGGRGIIRVERTSPGHYLLQGRNQQRVILPPQYVRESQLPSRLRALGLSGQYVVQQGIDLTLPSGRVHDFRLLIQKNGRGEWDVTGCAGRVGPPRSITSNLHGGGTAVPADRLLAQRFASAEQVRDIKQTMERIGFQAAEHLENKYGALCELGIDLAVDPKGGVWLLEVNPKPSREVFRKIGQRATYRRAVSRPLEYALWLYRQRERERQQSE